MSPGAPSEWCAQHVYFNRPSEGALSCTTAAVNCVHVGENGDCQCQCRVQLSMTQNDITLMVARGSARAMQTCACASSDYMTLTFHSYRCYASSIFAVLKCRDAWPSLA